MAKKANQIFPVRGWHEIWGQCLVKAGGWAAGGGPADSQDPVFARPGTHSLGLPLAGRPAACPMDAD